MSRWPLALLMLALGACGHTFEQPTTLPIARPRMRTEARTWIDTEDDFRARQPAPLGAAPRWLHEIQESRLSNNVRVLFVEDHALPILHFGVVVGRGAVDALPGAMSLMLSASLMGSKATRHDEYGTALRALGVQWVAHVSSDYSLVWMVTLPPLARGPIRLEGEAISEPEFDGEGFELLQKATLSALKQQTDDAMEAARQVARRLLYPPSHAYGTGTAERIPVASALKVGDLSVLHDQLVAKDDVTVVAAGDSDLESITSMFERGLGSLGGHAAPRAIVPAAPPPSRKLVVLSHTGLRQDKIVLNFMGVSFDHPDLPALKVATSMLVGAAWERIRTGHGTTYGVSGGLGLYRGQGPIEIEYAVDNSATLSSLSDLILTIKRLQSSSAEADWLARAKTDVAGHSLEAGDSSSDVLRGLASMAGLDLSLDAWTKLDERIAIVTASEVQRVATKYFDLDHLIMVIAGDADRLKRTLPSLGLGTPEVGTTSSP